MLLMGGVAGFSYFFNLLVVSEALVILTTLAEVLLHRVKLFQPFLSSLPH